MRLLVRAAPPLHYRWLMERVGFSPTAGLRAIEAIREDTGEIKGMVGFDLWTANAVQMHVALESPSALRALLGPAFSYPFEECGKGVVTGVVAASNSRALALDRHIGFREVGRISDGQSEGVDLVIFEMRKSECRWLNRRARRAA